MSMLDWTILVILAGIFLIGGAIWFWDSLHDMIDPRGQDYRGARRIGHSRRDARARADDQSPWSLALVSLMGFGGLLAFFLS